MYKFGAAIAHGLIVKKVCPYYVSDENSYSGKTDVWDLKDKQIFDYLKDYVKLYKSDRESFDNEFKEFIVMSDCWLEKNKSSDRLVYNIYNMIQKMDRGVREKLLEI